jgi:NADP-dependent 3-hydroxy acid dehydrogenase YdfG
VHSPKALITGSTKGIGRATAMALSKAGLHIIATGRNTKELDTLKKEITAQNGTCDIFSLDLTNSDELSTLTDRIGTQSLSLLVHCAGVALVGKIEEMNLNAWRNVLETNLTIPFILTQKCLPAMKPGSRIIFINSVGGKMAFPEWAAYCAAKHGLRALADVLRTEVAEKGIQVTSIFPTSVDTPMQAGLPYDWDRSKMLKAEDVARMIVNVYREPDNVVIKEIDLENPAGIF